MTKLNITLLILALILAIFLAFFGSESARDLQSGLMNISSPLLKGGQSMTEQFGAVGTGLKTLEQLEVEVHKLDVENRMLRARLQVLEGLKEENDSLRDALGFVRRSDFHLVAARVVSRDASTWWNSVRINRGFEDGVDIDMPVITEEGLVGKVTAVSKNLATVLLITDENCKVGVRIEDSRERGIAQGMRVSGSADGEIEVNFLNKNAKVKEGARVYTVGVEGGVFPPDLLIGTVTSFRARELDGQAIVRPAVPLSSIKDVFVIIR
jgi:rod shape-determining protein MreC